MPLSPPTDRAQGGIMCKSFRSVLFCCVLLGNGLSCGAGAADASKPHVIAFGKWTAVKCYAGVGDSKTVELKVRGLYVDTRVKDYTTGAPHEVTDRLFVVRRMFRLNDTPEETGSAPRWQRERGGWLLVDRVTGRVTQVVLPEFDPFYSTASL